MGYSEYRDLTPKNDINNGEEYIKALDWAFEKAMSQQTVDK